MQLSRAKPGNPASVVYKMDVQGIIGISTFKIHYKRLDVVIVSTHLALSDISFFSFLSDTSVGHILRFL